MSCSQHYQGPVFHRPNAPLQAVTQQRFWAPLYASFRARTAANLVDRTIMVGALMLLFLAGTPLVGEKTCVAGTSDASQCTLTDAAALWTLALWVVWLLGVIVYFSWTWQGSGQTLGMRAVRIKMVSDADPFQTISTGRAVLRVVVRTFPYLMRLGWFDSL